MLSRSQLLVISSFLLSAYAQTLNNGFRTRHTLAGSIVAGIIVAIAVGILLLICVMMSIRRRRHGQTVLPGPAGRIGGGFVRPTAPSTNYNNGVYGSGPYDQQFGSGNTQPYQMPAQPGTPPPPPYTGKEDSAPPPVDFAPPPGSPPEAHINDGQGHYPWFKASQ